jgi:hypothetical protein
LKTGTFTGLQVSHEPGQWAVWAGVVLMAIGLTFVFYVVHMRFWVVPVRDAGGGSVLWIGGTANRNRDAFEISFKTVVEQIQKELKPALAAAAPADATTISKTRTQEQPSPGGESGNGGNVWHAQRLNSIPRPATTMVVMVGLGIALPAVHRISECGEERKYSQ